MVADDGWTPRAGVLGCSSISGSSGQKGEPVRAVPRLSTHRPSRSDCARHGRCSFLVARGLSNLSYWSVWSVPKRRTKSSHRKKGHSFFRGLSPPRFFLHLPAPQIPKHLHGRMVVLGVVVARCHSPARDRIGEWTLQRSGANRLRVRIARGNSLSICSPSPTNLP